MNFEPMYDGALVTCSERVWQLGGSQPRLFLDPPASQDGTSGESRLLRPTSLRLLAPWPAEACDRLPIISYACKDATALPAQSDSSGTMASRTCDPSGG